MAVPTVPAPLMVLTAITSIQIGSALAAGLFETIGAPATVAWRLLLAAAFLLIATRPRLPKLDARAVAAIGAFGVVIATMNTLFYLAIERVPLGVVVTIEFLGPLGVAAWKSTRWLDRAWVALALSGVALLAPVGEIDLDLLGLSYAALAGAGWAGFVLLSAPVARRFRGNSGIALGMTLGALLTLPFGLPQTGAVFADLSIIGTLAAVALLSTAVPFSLEFQALKRLSATVYGTLIALEPAAAAAAGALILGESLGIRSLLALVLVSAAALGQALTAEREPPAP